MDLFTRKRFETLLHSTRDALLETLQCLNEPHEEHGRLGEPMDEADVAVLEHQRETLHRLRRRYGQLYLEIENALRRLRDGEYGICDRCGDPIQRERLEVQPTARLCIDCQRKEEKHKTVHKDHGPSWSLLRPTVTENVAPAPWRYPECVQP